MKGIIILADGFEVSEAITTINILRRAGIDLVTVSVNTDGFVKSQSDIIVKADYTLSTIFHNDYQFMILPGGGAVKALNINSSVATLIHQFVAAGKVVAAICAAPSLVGKHGYYDEHEYTCYPGYEKMITKGKYKANKTVVVDKNFITAKAMAYTVEFALAIVNKLVGKDIAKKVEKAICGVK